MTTHPRTPNPWRAALRAACAAARLHAADRPARIAVLGVGAVLHGDDGAGPTVIRVLTRMLALRPARANTWLVRDGGTTPENYAGPFARFAPDLLILVDAAACGARPGAIRWLDWRTLDGVSAVSHGFPLTLLGRYWEGLCPCPIVLLGIQPARTTFDTGLTPAVRLAAARVARALAGWAWMRGDAE